MQINKGDKIKIMIEETIPMIDMIKKIRWNNKVQKIVEVEVKDIEEHQYSVGGKFALISLKKDGIFFGCFRSADIREMMRKATPELFVNKIESIDI